MSSGLVVWNVEDPTTTTQCEKMVGMCAMSSEQQHECIPGRGHDGINREHQKRRLPVRTRYVLRYKSTWYVQQTAAWNAGSRGPSPSRALSRAKQAPFQGRVRVRQGPSRSGRPRDRVKSVDDGTKAPVVEYRPVPPFQNRALDASRGQRLQGAAGLWVSLGLPGLPEPSEGRAPLGDSQPRNAPRLALKVSRSRHPLRHRQSSPHRIPRATLLTHRKRS